MQTQTATTTAPATPKYTTERIPNDERPTFVVQGCARASRAFMHAKDIADTATQDLARAKSIMLELGERIRRRLKVEDPSTMRFLTGQNRSVDVIETRKFIPFPEDLRGVVAALPTKIRERLVDEFVLVAKPKKAILETLDVVSDVLKPKKDILETLDALKDELDLEVAAKIRAHLEPDVTVKLSATKTAPKGS